MVYSIHHIKFRVDVKYFKHGGFKLKTFQCENMKIFSDLTWKYYTLSHVSDQMSDKLLWLQTFPFSWSLLFNIWFGKTKNVTWTFTHICQFSSSSIDLHYFFPRMCVLPPDRNHVTSSIFSNTHTKNVRLFLSNWQNYNQFWTSTHLWPQTISTRTDKASRQYGVHSQRNTHTYRIVTWKRKQW